MIGVVFLGEFVEFRVADPKSRNTIDAQTN